MHGRDSCQNYPRTYHTVLPSARTDLVNKDGVTYVLKPQMQYFTDLDCILPVGSDGTVRLAWDGECLEVIADAEGGVLELGEEKISLVRGETRRVKI